MAEGERSPPIKRYRKEIKNESDDEWKVSEDESSNSNLYVPVKERRRQKLVKLGRVTEIITQSDQANKIATNVSTDSGASSAAEDFDITSSAKNKISEISKEELVKKEEEILSKSKDKSLLLQHSELKKLAEARQESELDKQLKEEEKILRSVAENTALKSAAEIAKGIEYVDPIKTSWKAPSRILAKGDQRHKKIRQKHNILIEGDNPPPPLTGFPDMKLNKGILKGNGYLEFS